MRPTLKEIAEATGYSIATVSRALNGSPRITPETRRSVLACARRTGYRTACRRVALIVPGYQFDGYFGSVLRLLAAELGRLDHPVEVLSSTGLDVLEEHSFCGAISVMAQNGLERYWGDRHILPLVCINTRPRHLDGIYTVGSNDEQAVRLAVGHLLERGHRRIGRFGGISSFYDPSNWNSVNRENAFRSQLAAHGLEPELYATNTGSTPSTIEAVKSLLDRGATALVTVNEGLELETLHALNVLGVRVPDEVALLSWTQPNPAGFVRPSISGIEQNFEELVRQSCETFRRLLAGEPAGDTLIDYRLQIRESSAKSVAAKGGCRK